MPEVSVCQGTKLSSTLYAPFTIDTLRFNKVMKNKQLYKQITGKELRNHNIISHKTITYVDDTQHMITIKTNEGLRMYIEDIHTLLIYIYRHNSSCINADKTEFLNFGKSSEDNNANFKITDHKGNMISQKKTMKVLGYCVNKENTLENHISSLAGHITATYKKIKEAIPYLSPANRKIILDAKLRGQLSLTLPLILNQNQRTQGRMQTLIMRINKLICGGNTSMKLSEKICKEIEKLLPEQEIIRSNAKFIHTVMFFNEPTSLHKHILKPRRSLFNQLHPDIKYLNPKAFAKEITKMELEYKPDD